MDTRKVYIINTVEEGYHIILGFMLKGESGKQEDLLGKLEETLGRFKRVCHRCNDLDYLLRVSVEYEQMVSRLVNALGEVADKPDKSSTEIEKAIYAIRFCRMLDIKKKIREFEAQHPDLMDYLDMMDFPEKLGLNGSTDSLDVEDYQDKLF